jgi:predicted nucleic acid-binding protein
VTTIVDASALVAYLLEEEGFEKMSEILSEEAESVPLLIKESCNAVLEAEKQGRISREDGEKILQVILSLEELNIEMVAQSDLIPAAFTIAEQNGLTIYDSIYIALAKASGGSLESRDRRQIEIASKLGVTIAKV